VDVLLSATDDKTPADKLILTIQAPAHGKLTPYPDGRHYQYQPEANFNGTDQFTFTATDAHGLTSEPATIAIDVAPVNDRPKVPNRTIDMAAGPVTEFLLWGTDAETSIDDLVYTIVTAPHVGKLTALGGRLYQYTPNPFYAGQVTLTYTATDNGDPAGSNLNPGPLTSLTGTITLQPTRQMLFDAKGKALYQDADGDWVTVALSGTGNGTIYFLKSGLCDAARIVLTGTTSRSSLTITTKGSGSETTIGGIGVYGSLGSITGKTTDLAGDVTVTGLLGSLVLDDAPGEKLIELNTNDGAVGSGDKVVLTFDCVADTSVNTHGLPISSLTVTEWLDTGGEADTILAPRIDKLTAKGARGNARLGIDAVAGDFAASLVLDGAGVAPGKYVLGGATIAGAITGGTWDICGSVGAIKPAATAAAWTLDADGVVYALDARDALAGTVQADYFGKLSTKGELAARILANGADPKRDTSIASIAAGTVRDVSINVPGGIAAIAVEEWLDGGQADVITAKWIGKITAKGRRANARLGLAAADGDFEASITLTGADARGAALGAASVAGRLRGTWDLAATTGAVGAIKANGTADDWLLDAPASAVKSLDAGAGDLAGALRALCYGKVSTKGQLAADLAATGVDARRGTSIDSLTAGSARNVSLTVPGGINSLTVAEWVDDGGPPDRIEAGWLGKLSVTGRRANARLGLAALDGDFQADVILTGQALPARKGALGSAKIAGALAEAAWAVTGDAGSVQVVGGVNGWSAAVGSLKSLAAGDVAYAVVDVADALGSVKAVRWADGGLSANTVGSLTLTGSRGNARLGIDPIPGDFGAELTVSGNGVPQRKAALGSVKIAGDLTGSVWQVAGEIGKVTVTGTAAHSVVAATGSIAGITLGAAEGSNFLAGLAYGASEPAATREDFQDPGACIKSVQIRGLKLEKGAPIPRFLSDTSFCAAQIGTVSLLNAEAGGDGPYGLVVLDNGGSEIRSITYRDTVTGVRWSWKPGQPFQNVGNLTLQVL
jgi:hypothetical protein